MLQLLAQGSEGSLLIWMVIGAVVFGAWSANAAERKGYPRSTGWALGILLGLLGRIIVGLMRDKRVDALQAQLNAIQGNVPVPPRSETTV